MEKHKDHQKGQPAMLRIFLALFLLTSCSMGTIKTGGQKTYAYDPSTLYKVDQLQALSNEVITTLKREPKEGKLDELFGKGQTPLRRIGILIFESEIQPTRDGLAGKNQIYLNEAGKQIMTENFLKIWEQSFPLLARSFDYVPTSKIKKARSFHEYGLSEDDFVKTKRTSLAPDDVFFLDSTKKTTTVTTVNPRGMRDMSFLLVPAYELMGGPKWSEQNKQFINDVSKELKLDAVIIVMSQVFWTAAHTDKHSGENVSEEITLKLQSSLLVPLHDYHARLEKTGSKDKPGVTLCYRAFETEVKLPATITVPEEKKNFVTIEREVLAPVFKTYKDLSQMMIMRISNELKNTF